ncbi:MAG: HU family DNA-binding protein [Candidatus Binatia bacterium]
MTKAELIESVASKVDLPRATAERAVNTMFDEMVSALKQGDKVNISGFGTFSISSRKARTGRNPKTGESIEIAASRAAKFKPGKTLKDEINDGK